MPSDSRNLFALQTESSRDSWFHGKAFAGGGYKAVASLHRGVSLSVEGALDVGLSGNAEIRDAADASLAAGADVKAGLGLEAAFPLDLFSEAGIVARFQAQAEAAAWVRAQIGLEFALFRRLLQDDVKLSGVWLELANIFIDESNLQAGLWGKASFSAEVVGQAAVYGSLVHAGDIDPGFTVVLDCAAGLGFGAGISFVHNVGFKDPQRLLNRLSDKLVAVLEDELQARITQVANPDAAKQAMAYVRLVLPLASRSAFSLAYKIATRPPAEHQNAAANSVVRSLVREGQELLLRLLCELGVKELHGRLGSQSFLDKLLLLSESDLESVLGVFADIGQLLWRLNLTEHASIDQWLGAIIDLLDPLASLLKLPLFDPEEVASWTDNLALLWSAAVLVRPIVGWATDNESSTPGTPFDGHAVTDVPKDLTLAQYVADRVSQVEGTARTATQLSFADLVIFIAADPSVEERVAAFVKELPDIAPAFDLLQRVFKGATSSPLVATFLKDLESRPLDARSILGELAQALPPVIESISTDLFQQLEQLGNSDVTEMIERVAKPTVLSLTAVAIPGIARLGIEPNADRTLREQLSAVLLQFLSRFLLVSSNVLLQHGASAASGTLRDLANEVTSQGRTDVVDKVRAIAVGSPLGLIVNSDDVAQLLRLIADAVERWNQQWRSQTFDQLETIVSLGLASGAGQLGKVWTDLHDKPDDMPVPDAVGQLTRLIIGEACDVLGFVVLGAAQILANHLGNLGRALIAEVQAAVTQVVAAAKQAVQWLDKSVDDLRAVAGQLAKDIEQIGADLAGDVAALGRYVEGLLDSIVGTVHDRGWQIVQAALFENWVYQHSGDTAGWLEQKVREGYDGLFNSVRHELDAPLSMLTSFADHVQQELNNQALGGGLDKEALVRSLKRAILDAGITDLRFTIDVFGVDLGTITLPAGSVAGAMIDTIFGDGVVDGHLNSAIEKGRPLPAKQVQLGATKAAIAGALSKAQAAQYVSSLFTGRLLSVEITEPKEGKTYTDEATLSVAIKGADSNFVNGVFGVPDRVKLLINGREYPSVEDLAVEQAGGLRLDATLVPTGVGVVPHPVFHTNRYAQFRVPGRYRIRRGVGRNLRGRPTNGGDDPGNVDPGSSDPGNGGSGGADPGVDQTIVLRPGLNVIHLVATDGSDQQPQVIQAIRSFYLRRSR